MNARRGFLKGVWITGAAATIALVAKQTQYELSKPEVEVEDISHLTPENQMVTLTICADNRTSEQKKKEEDRMSGSFYVFSNTHITNTVSMSVGKDNRLWIKIKDVWKRVAIDA